MPLEHSSSKPAFKRNVSTLMGEVGKSPHVKSRDQALAIAYSIKRGGQKRAVGGLTAIGPTAGAGAFNPTPKMMVRHEQSALNHKGPIMSLVPGRTDKHNMNVGSGSYVIPSHAVSHLGQNNTMAGMNVLNKMFSMGPYGGPASPKIKAGLGAPKMHRAAGGKSGGVPGTPTPVVTAGGEFVIPEDKVMEIGGGDLSRGHQILDAWMLQIQKEHAKTIATLPPPAKK